MKKESIFERRRKEEQEKRRKQAYKEQKRALIQDFEDKAGEGETLFDSIRENTELSQQSVVALAIRQRWIDTSAGDLAVACFFTIHSIRNEIAPGSLPAELEGWQRIADGYERALLKYYERVEGIDLL